MSKEKKRQYRLVYLMILLFFVSMITTFRLLAVMMMLSFLYSVYSLKRLPLLQLIKPVLPFVLLMLLPLGLSYLFRGSFGEWKFTLMILFKVMISAVFLGTAVEKHGAFSLIEELMELGFPPFFNRILGLTYRYFYMVYADVKVGRQALVLRGIQERKSLSTLSIFGEWIGGFFVKSSVHGDKVFQAMKARGFEGESEEKALLKPDLLLRILLMIGLLSLALYLEGRL